MKTVKRQRTILFLIADTGAGHRSAANAITRALNQLDPTQQPSPDHPAPVSESAANGMAQSGEQSGFGQPARVSSSLAISPYSQPRPQVASRPIQPPWKSVIVDAFAEWSRPPLRNGIFLYGPAIKYSPQLYGRIFRITNNAERFDAALRLFQPFVRQGLRRLLEQTRPDLIVSIHPLLNHVTLGALRDIGVRVPFITVVTDLVSIHYSWIAPGVDTLVVPTEEARRFAIQNGIPPRKVQMLGMPIDPKFAAPPDKTREEYRAELGIDVTKPAILLVGGGEGAGGLSEAVMALGAERLPAQLVVITGRNRQLYAELQRLRATFRTPAHVFGFVNNMPDFMRAADLIVTKAGPGTISEAMACGLPILLTGAVPGQEEGNVDFVLDNDLGMLTSTPAELVAAARALLDPANPLLARWREQVRRLSNPKASSAIARLIVSSLPPATAPSVWDSVRRRARNRGGRTLATQRSLMRRFATLSARNRWSRPLFPPLGLLRENGQRARRQDRHISALTNLMSMRELLGRREANGELQLRRPGRRRRRHDAGSSLGGGRR